MSDGAPRPRSRVRVLGVVAILVLTTTLLVSIAHLARDAPEHIERTSAAGGPVDSDTEGDLGSDAGTRTGINAVTRAVTRAASGADSVVEATLVDGDVSILWTFVPEDPEAGIGITRITAPDGTVLHDTTFASDSWEATAFSSVVSGEPLAASGDLALFLPASPDVPLVPGVYRVAFETDPADAVVVVEHTVKRAVDRAVERAIDRAQNIDIHVHVLHPDARFRDRRFARTVDTDWRAALEVMLSPHELGIGAATVTVATEDVSRRLTELDDEAEITDACRATRAALPAASRGSEALHVALVAEIVDAEGEDWLTGLSPQPGLPYHPGSPNGCLFIGERAWAEDRLDAATVTELMAANLLHELGHFSGLAHPSEVDGETFDVLDDTPRCTVPDALACGPAGGADNVMFHSGDADTLPWTLSADQAWVLRRHPLFR